jgi:hypothetical protein
MEWQAKGRLETETRCNRRGAASHLIAIDLAAPRRRASIHIDDFADFSTDAFPARRRMKLLLCALTFCLAGCVTPPREGIYRPGETEDQRIHREIFYSDWLRPSVSQEDREFFYEPFWKSR